MRILFSSVPGHGHVLPLLPLARAARRAGHETALLTGATMAEVVSPLQVLPAGPTSDAMMAEVARRTGGGDPGAEPTPALAAELFAGVRVDLTADEAIAAGRDWAPDLVVAEWVDFVGPLVAAALGIPWAAVAISLPLPEPMWQAMAEVAASRYADRGLVPTARIALVDPVPDALHADGWVAPQDRVAVRNEPHTRQDLAHRAATPVARGDLPRVLVTLGTVVDDPATLAAVVDSVAALDVDVVVTQGPRGIDDPDRDRPRVHPVGFVPLDELLGDVEVVVAAGGTGTVLAALSAGLPMVLVPVVADQPWNAARAAALGVAVVVSAPHEVGAAVRQVLADPSYRAAALALAARTTATASTEEVLAVLLDRAAAASAHAVPSP